MPKAERVALIQQIEQLRGNPLLVYVTGDRTPLPAQISDDALRPIYQQLRAIGSVDKLDLFIYSRGGVTDVPARIATAIRATAPEWNILIPFRANSATTLLALGADEIVLGRNGELGPIDPSLQIKKIVTTPNAPPTIQMDSVSVEDIIAYITFVKQRGGLKDQESLSAALSKLTDRVDALALGNAYRTHTHIRAVARQILASRKTPPQPKIANAIVSTLAEQVYAHGHAISYSDAKGMGLPVTPAEPTLDSLMWQLLEVYETDLKLLEPFDPHSATANTDHYVEQSVMGVIETSALTYELQSEIHAQVRRQLPQQMNVQVTLQLVTPVLAAGGAAAGGAPPALTAQQQQALLQQLQAALGPAAQQAAQQAIQQQAPVIAVDLAVRDAAWVKA